MSRELRRCDDELWATAVESWVLHPFFIVCLRHMLYMLLQAKGYVYLTADDTVILNCLCVKGFSTRQICIGNLHMITKQTYDNPFISSAVQFSQGTLLSCPSLAYDILFPSSTWRKERVVATAVCPLHPSLHPLPSLYMSSTFASVLGSSTNTRRPASSSSDALTLGREPAEPGLSPPTQPESPVKQCSI